MLLLQQVFNSITPANTITRCVGVQCCLLAATIGQYYNYELLSRRNAVLLTTSSTSQYNIDEHYYYCCSSIALLQMLTSQQAAQQWQVSQPSSTSGLAVTAHTGQSTTSPPVQLRRSLQTAPGNFSKLPFCDHSEDWGTSPAALSSPRHLSLCPASTDLCTAV